MRSNDTAQMSMTAFGTPPSTPVTPTPSLLDCLISFTGPAGQSTEVETVAYGSRVIPRYTNDYWTARQRQAASIQEISYRACFKPQLPGFFIDRLTEPGDVVYDP
ncbi:MAG: hypothetical protein PHN79_10460, partial [Methanoregula sp.]|nr:hypothetical protein [Methanoregula sp.]